ncbi:hypothetical protein Thiowin_02651 [Thiorhodovibrio winogradskyi]|uniref:Transposase/invertase (TIGR01784 family) n=1 Tax=Thiorhodovibrio winogradskyi TaxID=77007 RepID=A0ABZ0SC03_9GAMM|nr:hypothetical protein [Thiorhodovibrio winogradskyi]
MNNLAYPPVQKAQAKLRAMSADEQERHWAESRARALSDEVTLLNEAHKDGHKEGHKEGDQHARRQTALALLQKAQFDIPTIAICTGLSEGEVRELAVGQTN